MYKSWEGLGAAREPVNISGGVIAMYKLMMMPD